jgi:hypothetical protein
VARRIAVGELAALFEIGVDRPQGVGEGGIRETGTTPFGLAD